MKISRGHRPMNTSHRVILVRWLIALALFAWWGLVAARYEGVVTSSWWLVLAPLWLPAGALVVLCAGSWAAGLFFAALGHVQAALYWRKQARERRHFRRFNPPL